MNANSAKLIKNHLTPEHTEITTYAVLAFFLIGHVFFVDNQISSINILLLALGTIFGMLTAFACAPIVTQLPNPVVSNLAEVLPFRRNHKQQDNDNTNGRHAA